MLIGLVFSAVSSGNAQTQDEESINVGTDIEFRSRYLFAGVPFSTGPVMQARLSLGYSGFTVNAFANYDADTGEFNERDVSAD